MKYQPDLPNPTFLARLLRRLVVLGGRPAELLPEGSDNDPARTALVEWRHSGGGDVTSVVGCGEHFGSADAAALAGLGPTFAELPSQSALVAALLQARPHPRHFLDTS